MLPIIRSAALSLLLLLQMLPLLAQSGEQSIYNSAVDMVNCKTIQFIHGEAGRADVANEMSCTSFEGIEQGIPSDESATLALARAIEGYKNRFAAIQQPDRAQFAKSLDDVIGYAIGRITAKPRRGNVEAFKQELARIKAMQMENFDRLHAAVQSETPSAAPAHAETETEPAIVADNLQDRPSQAASLVSWLALAVACAALALGLYLFIRLRESHATPSNPAEANMHRSGGGGVESLVQLKALQKQAEEKSEQLNREYADRHQQMRTLLEREIQKAHSEIQALRSEIKNMLAVPTTPYKPAEPTESKFLAGESEVVPPPHAPEDDDEDPDQPAKAPTFVYSSLPSSPEKFDAEALAPEPHSNSVFEIEQEPDQGQTALFSYLSYVEVAEKILAHPEKYLYPFAEMDHPGESTEGKRRIIQLKEGQLEKEGNSWRVVSKIKIKLE